MQNGVFDRRVIIITIEVDNKPYSFRDLAIKVSGEKNTGKAENTCNVEITNIDGAKRYDIIQSTTPWSIDRTRKRLKVEAGTEQLGQTVLFIGDITAATPSQPPDIGLKITAKTNNYMKGKIVSQSGGETDSTESIIKNIANDSDLTVDWQAQDKKISSYSFTGTAAEQISNISDFGGVECFVDDNNLIVKEPGKPRSGGVRILNKNSGMIGVPEMTEHGVRVKFLFDPQTQVGGGN